MLQAEYVRDMHNNYIILKGIEGKVSAYETRMLLNNAIPGILKTELRCIDQTDLFYYDITSKKSITSYCENRSLNHTELKKILTGILKIIDNSGEFLLSENDFIIDPDYIFIDNGTQDLGLCCLPGSGEKIQKQLRKLMEYLMNKVDYKDEGAVVLIYAMYKESREIDCTFEKLLKELDKKNNEPGVKKIKGETEVSGNNRDFALAGEINVPYTGGRSIQFKQLDENQINKSQNGSQIDENHIGKNKTGKNKINESQINIKQKSRFGKRSNQSQDSSSHQNLKLHYKSCKQKSQNQRLSNQEPQDQKLQNQKPQTKKLPDQKIQNHKFQNHKFQNQKSGNPIQRDSACNKQNTVSFVIKIQTIYENVMKNRLEKNIRAEGNSRGSQPMEEVESEREIQFFGPKTFILAGVSIIAGVVLFLAALQLKLLHNTFGTHIDVIKFFSCILILGCLETYIFLKLFDSRNKLTNIRTEVEYVEPENKEEDTKINRILLNKDGVYEDENGSYEYNRAYNEQNYHEEEIKKIDGFGGEPCVGVFDESISKDADHDDGATGLLWADNEDYGQDATVVLSKLPPQKMYRLTAAREDLKQEVTVEEFPFLIGKLIKGVDLTIEEYSVSRRHARLTKVGEDIFLTDLNSTNGTFLNGMKLQGNKPYLLTEQDEISFSNIKYTWSVDT